jgi:hypothetical protein
VHYARTRLNLVAKEKKAVFIAKAWRTRLPGGEDPAKYKLMNFGRRVYYVDLNNKAAIERPGEESTSPVIEAEHQMAEEIQTATAPEPVDQGNYPDLGDLDITAPEKAPLKWEPVATKEVSAWSQIVTEKLSVTLTLQLFRDIIMTKEHHVWKVDRILHTVVRGV